VPKQLSAPTTRPGHRRLQALAEDLSEEVEVGPLLDRILTHSTRLLDGAAGSISLVDEDAGYYRKAADLGVACSSGQVFPLDEGVTGQVVAERRPVVLDRYAAVTGGHLPSGDPVAEGGVVAVPIWWRDAIGADVVFAGRRRQFTTTEVDRLETVAQVAAVAITNARGRMKAEAEARRSTAADRRDAATRGLATVRWSCAPPRRTWPGNRYRRRSGRGFAWGSTGPVTRWRRDWPSCADGPARAEPWPSAHWSRRCARRAAGRPGRAGSRCGSRWPATSGSCRSSRARQCCGSRERR
jgi:hypothetical protein